jgi:pyruvate/2-oxoglutarate dehydrogenase complex dihydrolipoamide dehydrogenase (E3) component
MASHADGSAAAANGGAHHVYDLVVIGGGSGGIATAKRAAGHGARVALVEASGAGRLGGTCVNVGCVPKKVMWHAAELAGGFALAPAYGFGVGDGDGEPAAQPQPPRLSMRHLKAARDAYVARLNGLYARGLQTAGVTVYDGRATLTGKTTAVEGDSDKRRHVVAVTPSHSDGGPTAAVPAAVLLEAPHVLIATGSRARLPPIPGIHHALTSDGFFGLDAVPPTAAILGGGYIACELAGILASLGCAVTLLPRRADGLLAGFDESLRDAARESLTGHGVTVLLGAAVTEIVPVQQAASDAATAAAEGAAAPSPGALHVRVAAVPTAAVPDGTPPPQPSSRLLGPFAVVIAATGRSPNSEGLGLEAAGVATVGTPAPVPGYAWAHMLADEEEGEGEGEGSAATAAASSWRARCGLAGGVGASALPACPPAPPQAATAGADTLSASSPGHAFAPAVDVDAFQNSSVPGIYAVGDVTGRAQLTPVAIAAGRLLADRLFDPRHAQPAGGERTGASLPLPRLEYDAIPTVVFTHPPLGSVGLTEAEARATYERRSDGAGSAGSHQRVDVWTSSFTPLMHGLLQVAHAATQATAAAPSGGSGSGIVVAPTHAHSLLLPPPTKCRVKLVTVGASHTVVGLHLAGPGADEALQGFAVAVRLGATKADLDAAVAIHPTFAEEAVTLAPWAPRPPAVADGGLLELRRRAGGSAAGAPV